MMNDNQDLREMTKKGEAILSEAQGLTFDLLNFEDKYLRNQTGEQRFLRSGVGMERQIEELEATNLKTIQLLQEAYEENMNYLASNDLDTMAVSSLDGDDNDVIKDPRSLEKELQEESRSTSSTVKKIFDQMHDQYTTLEKEVMGTHTADKKDSTGGAPTVATLTAQMNKLKGQLESANLFIETTKDQYNRDTRRFESERKQLSADYTIVCNRLLLAEGKKRFDHQVARDENFVMNVVSKFEFDEMTKQRNEWNGKYDKLHGLHVVLQQKLLGTEEMLTSMTIRRDELQAELNRMKADLAAANQISIEQKTKIISVELELEDLKKRLDQFSGFDSLQVASLIEENKRLKDLLDSQKVKRSAGKPKGYLTSDDEEARIASLKPIGILNIKLISCSDLLNADAENGGLSDPYVTLKLSHGATAKSKRFNNNLNPVFNETHKLSWNGVDPLEVGVWDFDLNQGEGENDPLGDLVVDAANFDFSSGKSIIITNRRLDNVSRGKISLEISFTSKSGGQYVFNGIPGAPVIRPAVRKPVSQSAVQPTAAKVSSSTSSTTDTPGPIATSVDDNFSSTTDAMSIEPTIHSGRLKFDEAKEENDVFVSTTNDENLQSEFSGQNVSLEYNDESYIEGRTVEEEDGEESEPNEEETELQYLRRRVRELTSENQTLENSIRETSLAHKALAERISDSELSNSNLTLLDESPDVHNAVVPTKETPLEYERVPIAVQKAVVSMSIDETLVHPAVEQIQAQAPSAVPPVALQEFKPSNEPSIDYKRLWEESVKENHMLKGQMKILKLKKSTPSVTATNQQNVVSSSPVATESVSLVEQSTIAVSSEIPLTMNQVDTRAVEVESSMLPHVIVNSAMKTVPAVSLIIAPKKKVDEITRFNDLQDDIIPALRSQVLSDKDIVNDLDSDLEIPTPDELIGSNIHNLNTEENSDGIDDVEDEIQRLEAEEDAEIKQMQDSILQEHIIHLSRIGRKDFEKLVKLHMANADLAHLTFLQYFYNTLKADSETEGSRVSKPQLRAVQLEYDLLLDRMADLVTLEHTAMFRHKTEVYIMTLNGFGAWKNILHAAQEGGVLRDILEMHLQSLNRVILRLGGWKQAFRELMLRNVSCDEDIHFWPEHLRIKILEFFRHQYREKTKMHLEEIEEAHDSVARLNKRLEVLSHDLHNEQETSESTRKELAIALKELNELKKVPISKWIGPGIEETALLAEHSATVEVSEVKALEKEVEDVFDEEPVKFRRVISGDSIDSQLSDISEIVNDLASTQLAAAEDTNLLQEEERSQQSNQTNETFIEKAVVQPIVTVKEILVADRKSELLNDELKQELLVANKKLSTLQLRMQNDKDSSMAKIKALESAIASATTERLRAQQQLQQLQQLHQKQALQMYHIQKQSMMQPSTGPSEIQVDIPLLSYHGGQPSIQNEQGSMMTYQDEQQQQQQQQPQQQSQQQQQQAQAAASGKLKAVSSTVAIASTIVKKNQRRRHTEQLKSTGPSEIQVDIPLNSYQGGQSSIQNEQGSIMTYQDEQQQQQQQQPQQQSQQQQQQQQQQQAQATSSGKLKAVSSTVAIASTIVKKNQRRRHTDKLQQQPPQQEQQHLLEQQSFEKSPRSLSMLAPNPMQSIQSSQTVVATQIPSQHFILQQSYDSVQQEQTFFQSGPTSLIQPSIHLGQPSTIGILPSSFSQHQAMITSQQQVNNELLKQSSKLPLMSKSYFVSQEPKGPVEIVREQQNTVTLFTSQKAIKKPSKTSLSSSKSVSTLPGEESQDKQLVQQLQDQLNHMHQQIHLERQQQLWQQQQLYMLQAEYEKVLQQQQGQRQDLNQHSEDDNRLSSIRQTVDEMNSSLTIDSPNITALNDNGKTAEASPSKRPNTPNMLLDSLVDSIRENTSNGRPMSSTVNEKYLSSTLTEQKTHSKLIHTQLEAKYQAEWAADMPYKSGLHYVRLNNVSLELCPGIFLDTSEHPNLGILPIGLVLARTVGPNVQPSGGVTWPKTHLAIPTLPNGIIAVSVPPVLKTVCGLQFVANLTRHEAVKLPSNIIAIWVDKHLRLPKNMELVQISDCLLSPNSKDVIPRGYQLITSNDQKDIGLPIGMKLTDTVVVAKDRSSITLPFGVHMVRILSTCEMNSKCTLTSCSKCFPELPSGFQYLAPDLSFATERKIDEIVGSFCCSVAALHPPLVLPSGVIAVIRPKGCPVPYGMTLTTKAEYNNQVPDGVELYTLNPSYAFPPYSQICDAFRFCTPPIEVGLEPLSYLLERDGGANVPGYMIPTSIPPTEKKMMSNPHVVEINDDPMKGLECFQFAPGSRLPVGSKISNSITVISDVNLKVDLPFDVYFVRIDREKNDDFHRYLGKFYELGTGSFSLPDDYFPPKGLDIIHLLPLYILPRGVILQPGAVLGKGIQLAPGSILGPGLVVCRRPGGLILPSGNEFVHLDPGYSLPVGFEVSNVDVSYMSFPKGYIVVQLPTHVALPSDIEINDSAGDLMFNNLDDAVEGSLILRRSKSNGILPLLPNAMKLVRSVENGSEFRSDLVKLQPDYHFPPGLELFPGIVTANCSDVGLTSIPADVCIVKVAYGTTLPDGMAVTRLNDFPESIYDAEFSYAAINASKIKIIHSWGGCEVKSVLTKAKFYLPPYVFLIESPSNWPDFLRQYTGPLSHETDLLPNTTVAEIVPSFTLPIGTAVPDTSLVLQQPFKLSNGDKFGLDISVVRTRNHELPGMVDLANTTYQAAVLPGIVPTSFLSMRRRLRVAAGFDASDSSRLIIYPTVVINSVAQDGRKTTVINTLKHQIQLLENENTSLIANCKHMEGNVATAETQIAILNGKNESLQGVINLLKQEATERSENLNNAMISLKKAERDLALKKEGFAKSQKDALSSKVKFDSQIQFLHKQVEYWKTLQIRAAYETDSEKIVTAAAVNEPSVSKSSPMMKLAGITKLLTDVAPTVSVLNTVPVSPFSETTTFLKNIISNLHREFIDSHNADLDWAKSLSEPLLSNFASPFENDEHSLKISPSSSPTHSIKHDGDDEISELMSLSASTTTGTSQYISIHERLPIRKGGKQSSSYSVATSAAASLSQDKVQVESRPNMVEILHYFEAMKNVPYLLLPETLNQIQTKKVALEKECSDIQSHEMLKVCVNHISEYILLVHGAMKLSRQKLLSKYLKAFSNVCLEMHAYYIDRQSIFKKNKHLSDGMEMMRELVDGGSGLSYLTAAQEKLQESEERISILRSSYGKGMLEVLNGAVDKVSSYAEVENSLMLASMAAAAEASRLEGKLSAWTVASKHDKVKATKHRIEKLRMNQHEYRTRAEIIKNQSKETLKSISHEISLFDSQVSSLFPTKVLSKVVKYFSGIDNVAKTEALHRVLMRGSSVDTTTSNTTINSTHSPAPEQSSPRRVYKPPLAPITSTSISPISSNVQETSKGRGKVVAKNTLKLKPLDATILSAAAFASAVDVESEEEQTEDI